MRLQRQSGESKQHSPSTPVDQQLLAMPLSQLATAVRQAYRYYTRLPVLASSLLAGSSIAEAALLAPRTTATADDVGRAVRAVLTWAGARLAPAAPRFPLGSFRPHHDATWTDPSWWKYNIIRHLYIEREHQATRSRNQPRAQVILIKSEIPNRKRFERERQQAFEDIARMIVFELMHHRSADEIGFHAAHEFLLPVRKQRSLMEMLTIAANFLAAFSRQELSHIAVEEGIENAQSLIDKAVLLRLFALAADGHLWVHRTIQSYCLKHQSEWHRINRNSRLAETYLNNDVHLACRHMLRAGRHQAAAELITSRLSARQLIDPRKMAIIYHEFDPIHLPSAVRTDLLRCQQLIEHLLAANDANIIQAFHVLDSTDDADAQANMLLLLFSAVSRIELVFSIRLLDECLTLSNCHPLLVGEALRLKAKALLDQHQFAEAQRCVDLLDVAKFTAAPELWTSVLELRGLIALFRDQDYAASSGLFEQAVACFVKLGMESRAAVALYHLVDVYLRSADLERAEQTSLSLLDLVQKTADQELVARALYLCGQIARRMGNMEDSCIYYTEAARIGRHSLDRIMRCHVLTELAEVSSPSRQHGCCDTMIVQAFALAQLTQSHGLLERIGRLLLPRQHLKWLLTCYGFGKDHYEALLLAAAEGSVTAERLSEAANVPVNVGQNALSDLAIRGVMDRHEQCQDARFILNHIDHLIGGDENQAKKLSEGETDEKRALLYLRQHGQITVADLAQICSVSRATGQRILLRWIVEGRVEKKGHGRATYYRLLPGR